MATVERHRIDTDGSGKHRWPRHKVLLLSSRGIIARHRHLKEDLARLIPHHKHEPKFDQRNELSTLDDLARLRGCDVTMFLETRRHQDLFLWLSQTEKGPTVKFQVFNVRTSGELSMAGNALLHSRPVVAFDASFDGAVHLRVAKELLKRAFATPNKHHRSKPFVDHVLQFTHVDGFIFFRNFQIERAAQPGAAPRLVEIGPRFALQPVAVLAGAFGGAQIWRNAGYVAPAAANALRRAEQGRAQERKIRRAERARERIVAKPANPIDSILSIE